MTSSWLEGASLIVVPALLPPVSSVPVALRAVHSDHRLDLKHNLVHIGTHLDWHNFLYRITLKLLDGQIFALMIAMGMEERTARSCVTLCATGELETQILLARLESE